MGCSRPRLARPQFPATFGRHFIGNSGQPASRKSRSMIRGAVAGPAGRIGTPAARPASLSPTHRVRVHQGGSWSTHYSGYSRIQHLDYVFVQTGWVTGKRRRQEAVEVQLGVDALKAARTGTIQAIALFAGDADFTPLAEAVHRAGTRFLVVAWTDSLSQELANAADLVIALPHPKNLGTDVLAP